MVCRRRCCSFEPLPLVITLVILIWQSSGGVWDWILTCPSSFPQIPETNPITQAEGGWKTLLIRRLWKRAWSWNGAPCYQLDAPLVFAILLCSGLWNKPPLNDSPLWSNHPKTGLLGLLVSGGWDYILMIAFCLGSAFSGSTSPECM